MDAHFDRAVAREKQGYLDKAIADCSEAIRLAPDDIRLRLYRNELYYAAGDFDRAILDCNVAIQMSPGDSVGYYDRAMLYLNKGDLQHCIDCWTEILHRNAKSALALFHRSQAYWSIGDKERAYADINQAVALQPAWIEPRQARAFDNIEKGGNGTRRSRTWNGSNNCYPSWNRS